MKVVIFLVFLTVTYAGRYINWYKNRVEKSLFVFIRAIRDEIPGYK
jgi:hypothetical protein